MYWSCSVVSLFGILIGSSSTLIFGEYIWSPLHLMQAFLEKFPSKSTRAGVARSEERRVGKEC